MEAAEDHFLWAVVVAHHFYLGEVVVACLALLRMVVEVVVLNVLMVPEPVAKVASLLLVVEAEGLLYWMEVLVVDHSSLGAAVAHLILMAGEVSKKALNEPRYALVVVEGDHRLLTCC